MAGVGEVNENVRFVYSNIGCIVDMPNPAPWWHLPKFQFPIAPEIPKLVFCVFNEEDKLVSVHETIDGALAECEKHNYEYEPFIVER